MNIFMVAVAQGIGQESIWRYLNRQVFLGDDHFVQQMQQKVKGLSEDFNIPKTHRRPTALPLEKITKAHANRNEAIMAMYATDEYSYLQIAAPLYRTRTDQCLMPASVYGVSTSMI